MPLPNFMIIGAAKSGTTSLYHYLKEHPQIFMSPVKETEYFSFMGETVDPKDKRQAPANYAVTDRKAYEALFEGSEGKIAVGEASPHYMYHPEAARRIHEAVPHAKIVAILRDPADRAYSHYVMRRHKSNPDLVEPAATFEEALELEDSRIREGWRGAWHYQHRGFYYEQLKRFYDVFGKDRIFVCLYEDLRTDPGRVLRDLFRFLGVEENHQCQTGRIHNRGKYNSKIKNLGMQRFLTQENPLKSFMKTFLNPQIRSDIKKWFLKQNLKFSSEKPQPLSKAIRAKLVEAYRPDILKLQELIGRDLSAWLEI